MLKGILKSLHAKVPTKGLRDALTNLKSELGMYRLHRKGLKQAKRTQFSETIKLQLGCGTRPKKGWLNVDLSAESDLKLDLREPFPIPEGTCEIIYSEHFLEHVDYPEMIETLLGRCMKLLRPGGIFSAVVPDIGLVLHSYVNGGTEEYHQAQNKWNPQWCNTQMEHVNYNFRQNEEHKFAYDFETMKQLLEKCGFENVVRREYDPELDSEDRIVGSLYVECRKPGASA